MTRCVGLPQAPSSDSPRVVGRRGFLTALGLIGGGALVAGPLTGLASRAGAAPAASAVEANRLTSIGLYSHGWDYLANRQSILDLGVTTLRTSNSGMYEEAWRAMAADGLNGHVTISGSDRSKFSSDDAWIADYLTTVDDFLGRYPARWVEVWNEPNAGMWSGATTEQKQAAYGRLLVAAYAHIKSNWPDVGVVGFAASGASAAAPGFIKGVLQAVPEAAKSFDVCSFHPYIGNTAPDQVREEAWGSWTIAGQVAGLRAAGITNPIWFTECGWQIASGEGGKFAKPATATVSPNLSAVYRVRLAVLAMSLGVERLHHMYVVDTDGYNGGFFANGVARPQATALRFQQAIIGETTRIETLEQRPELSAYRATTPSGRVLVAWSDSDETLTVDLVPGSSLVDMYGNQLAQLGGRTRIELGCEPVYIVEGSVPSGDPRPNPPASSTPPPAKPTPSPPKPKPKPKPSPKPKPKVKRSLRRRKRRRKSRRQLPRRRSH